MSLLHIPLIMTLNHIPTDGGATSQSNVSWQRRHHSPSSLPVWASGDSGGPGRFARSSAKLWVIYWDPPVVWFQACENPEMLYTAITSWLCFWKVFAFVIDEHWWETRLCAFEIFGSERDEERRRCWVWGLRPGWFGDQTVAVWRCMLILYTATHVTDGCKQPEG